MPPRSASTTRWACPRCSSRPRSTTPTSSCPTGSNVRSGPRRRSPALTFDMIAPAHGIIWRSHVPEILEMYEKLEQRQFPRSTRSWSTTPCGIPPRPWPREITEAFIEMGIPARLLDLKVNHISDIMAEVLNSALHRRRLADAQQDHDAHGGVVSLLHAGLGAGRARGHSRSAATAGRPWAPNEVYQALESCKFTLPEAPLTHQWVEDEEGLNALHDAIVDYVSLFHERA